MKLQARLDRGELGPPVEQAVGRGRQACAHDRPPAWPRRRPPARAARLLRGRGECHVLHELAGHVARAAHGIEPGRPALSEQHQRRAPPAPRLKSVHARQHLGVGAETGGHGDETVGAQDQQAAGARTGPARGAAPRPSGWEARRVEIDGHADHVTARLARSARRRLQWCRRSRPSSPRRPSAPARQLQLERVAVGAIAFGDGAATIDRDARAPLPWESPVGSGPRILARATRRNQTMSVGQALRVMPERQASRRGPGRALPGHGPRDRPPRSSRCATAGVRPTGTSTRAGTSRTELDFGDAHFFDDAYDALVCCHHGARYRPETGECVDGPCEGGRLTALAMEERDGRAVVRGSDAGSPVARRGIDDFRPGIGPAVAHPRPRSGSLR